MSSQSGIHSKATLAKFAYDILFLLVDKSDVSVQFRDEHKRFSTMFTFLLFFALIVNGNHMLLEAFAVYV